MAFDDTSVAESSLQAEVTSINARAVGHLSIGGILAEQLFLSEGSSFHLATRGFRITPPATWGLDVIIFFPLMPIGRRPQMGFQSFFPGQDDPAMPEAVPKSRIESALAPRT
jgi:hypothetical protein